MNAKKRALGRGLSALLDNNDENNISDFNNSNNLNNSNIDNSKNIINIPLEQIESNPFQPRLNFDDTALQELANSIKKQGVIQPITVRKLDDEQYQLISGERRLKASKIAGLIDIPAYIRDATDKEMLEMALVENIQRENLNAIEIASSYQRLMDECDLTQELLSERVSKNRTTVTNYLRLLKLPEEIQKGVIENKISMGHARALINIPSIDTQLSVFKKIIDKDLSVRNVEEIVKNIGNEPIEKIVSFTKIETPEKFSMLQSQIAQKLNTKILLKRNHKGEGSIVINFRSDDDLERIFSIIDK